MGKNLAEECVDAECFGLARLNAKGNNLIHTELDSLAEDGSLHQANLVDLLHPLAAKGHEICVVYLPSQWLDVDDAADLLAAGKVL